MELVKINLVPSTENYITAIDKRGTVTNIPIGSDEEFNFIITSLIETFSGTRNYTLALITSKTNLKSITFNVIDSLLGSVSSSAFVVLSDNMYQDFQLDSSVVTYLNSLTNLTKQ
jgi:hypothetical protein